jgi:chromosomal replication initiator protein
MNAQTEKLPCFRERPTPPPIALIEGEMLVNHIVNTLCHSHNMTRETLNSKNRKESVAWLRFVCFTILREATCMSLQEIGGAFGGKDHGTVMHGIKRVEDRRSIDAQFNREFARWEEHFCKARGYKSLPANMALVKAA